MLIAIVYPVLMEYVLRLCALLKPRYTMVEIRTRLAQSKRDYEAGLGQDSEEMSQELEEDPAHKDKQEMV